MPWTSWIIAPVGPGAAQAYTATAVQKLIKLVTCHIYSQDQVLLPATVLDFATAIAELLGCIAVSKLVSKYNFPVSKYNRTL